MTAKEDFGESSTGPDGQPTTTTTTTTTTSTVNNTSDQQQAPPPDYESSVRTENELEEVEDDNDNEPIAFDEKGEPKFITDELAKLEEQVNRIRWTVPVLPDGELIKCLRAAVQLAREKLDTKSEACQRFIRDSLVISFTKIFCDEAVQSWKYEIYVAIYKNAMVFLRLCALKLDDDCFPLLEILSFVMNPIGRFHQSNYNRTSMYQPQNAAEPFAALGDYRSAQRGWLVDFINKFGDAGGFDKLLARLTASDAKLTVSVIVALLKPWGLCYDYLGQATVKKYFAPIIEFVPQFLDQLSESELKIETKSESKSDSLSAVIKWLRHLASRLPDSEKTCRNLDTLRLKIILRLLQTDSFSGKMNALNDVNKLLPSLSSISRVAFNRPEDKDGLTSEKFIQWIEENQILDILLRDCLHQPQYVEKLEKLLRFIIKEQALSRNDLAKIWNASCGKHEAIEKNVHDLLAKLAWDFSPEQLEQLFDCFRESWTKASKKQREKLLELIRRLAEDDKEGLMANKVLELLWNVSHDTKLPTEIIEQALAAHLKILDYNCLLEKDKTRIAWIERIIDEVKENNHVLISIKHIREICAQFHESLYSHSVSRIGGPMNRLTLIDMLETKHTLSGVITENLCQYMDSVRQHQDETKKTLVADEFLPDGRFDHSVQIQERLTFLKFILKDGQRHLGAEYMRMIWTCLAEHPICSQDREQCFRWFADIIDDVGFEARAGRDFFQNQFMKLDPHRMTDLGMNCFDRFFKSVNAQSNKFQQKRRSVKLISDDDLVGIDYLWKLILSGHDDVAARGIQSIKEVYTNVSPQLKADGKRIHQSFIDGCFARVKDVHDEVKSKSTAPRMDVLIRLLTLLRDYLAECDYSYHKERSVLPMARAFRGRPVTLTIRFSGVQNRQSEDVDHQCHSNETWGQIRRMISSRYKASYGILELVRNNDLLDPADDNKTLAQTDNRDRITVSVRWVQQTTHTGSSGESSSSESEMNNNNVSTAVSHQTRILDAVDTNAESALPSVIFSQKHEYYQFLIEISDLACKEDNTRLRDTSRDILDLLPVDPHARQAFASCFSKTNPGQENESNQLSNFYFHTSPTQMLYNLKTTLIRLSPAVFTPNEYNEVDALHVFFLHMGGLACLLKLLTQKKYTDQCDTTTRKSIYAITFCILKRFLIILGLFQLKITTPDIYTASIEQILQLTPMTTTVNEQQQSTTSLELRVVMLLHNHMNTYPISKGSVLQYEHIVELIRLLWCLASGNKQVPFEQSLKSDFNAIHQSFKQENFDANEDVDPQDYTEEDEENQSACREGLELFCLAITLVPACVERLMQETYFEQFLVDVVLYCHYASIRHTAADQIYLLATRGAQGQHEPLLRYLIDRQFQLFHKHPRDLKTYSAYSSDFFSLLCRLLAWAYANRIVPSNTNQQLHDDIAWLKALHLPVDDHLLHGHLNLAKELLQFQSSERKRFYGIEQALIPQLMEQFLFPASKLLHEFRTLKAQRQTNPASDSDNVELKEPQTAICQLPFTTSAAFELLVTLATDCLDNLKLIDTYLNDLFYSAPDAALTEWDFALPVGSRLNRSFVGLRNAGATCYMNSVLQQLFMTESIRSALLSVKIPAEYGEDEFDDDDVRRDTPDTSADAKSFLKDKPTAVPPAKDPTKDRNEYQIQIFRQIQRIFGHLLESKLQFYIPRGFWKIFKFGGEPVNLRDQQDAVEFLNTLVDNIDEALKIMKLPQICSRVLGGTFADQKICKDCPHRYTRDEDFTLLSVDIRHSQNLKESLEQYVIGELLDGPNAYFCEKCNKKVDTVKRTCFKRLPAVLAIQLKRFDYDWERETPIKFNDYFEFPRELDMEPYTVQGLAKAEGTPVAEEGADGEQTTTDTVDSDGTQYKLVGIIVHMGQANGGHYYSFIQQKDDTDYSPWYKFDDTDVSDCKMNDDEELRSQCFGGDHSSSPFDQPPMKRQRRWWNAYILFYEKLPSENSAAMTKLERDLAQTSLYDREQRMPLSVQRSVRKQNIKFLHNRILFSQEYFTFIKRLVQSNVHQLVNLAQQQQLQETEAEEVTNTIEELGLISMEIATKFLFTIGWHTKKALRGAPSEWTELISHCLRCSRQARQYLTNVLFEHPARFLEYFIDCTSMEIRNAFGRILVALATHSRQDERDIERGDDDLTVEEKILQSVLRLAKKDGPDSVKVNAQYFQFFINYCSHGRHECENLIRLNVPVLFAKLANDDVSSSAMPRYGEPSKLSIILSTLIRCFDASSICRSSQPHGRVLPNPFHTHENGPVCPIPTELVDLLYKRNYVLKKIIEDANTCEELARFLRFLVWENPHVTAMALREILASLSIFYSCDLRAHLDILSMMLAIEDSWQQARLLYVLKGTPIVSDADPTTSDHAPAGSSTTINSTYHETPQSLLDLFSKSKSNNEKRAYQFIKATLQIFITCPKASELLQADPDLKRRWTQAVRWLHEQLERSMNISPYYSTQGQVTSNESSQGYYLERTLSAKSVLEKASELCSDKVSRTRGLRIDALDRVALQENEDEAASNSDEGEADDVVSPSSPRKPATPQSKGP